MNRRISLIMPVAESFTAQSEKVPPYALLYIGSELKRNGYEVKIHHDSDINKIADEVKEYNPFLVGISAFTGKPTKMAYEIAKKIKSWTPELKIVLGGYHATLMPKQCIIEEEIDFVVIGEGEKTIVELALAIERGDSNLSNILGLCWKSDNGAGDLWFINKERPFESNIDIDIDWSLIDFEKYVNTVGHLDNKRLFYIFSSRGCVGGCSFCAGSFIYKRRYRKESAKHVIDNYRNILNDHKIKLVEYLDDNFFVDIKWAREVASGIGRPYRALIRLDRIDEEVCDMLNDTKCRALFVGIESGNEHVRNGIMHKGISDATIYNALTMLKVKCPQINITGMFIFGIPGETYHQFRDTVKFALDITNVNPRLFVQGNTYAPYPYCDSYKDAVKSGWNPPERMFEWDMDSKIGFSLQPTWLSYYSNGIKTKFDRTAIMFMLLRRNNELSGIKFAVKELLSLMARFRLKYDFYLFPVDIILFWEVFKRRNI